MKTNNKIYLILIYLYMGLLCIVTVHDLAPTSVRENRWNTPVKFLSFLLTWPIYLLAFILASLMYVPYRAVMIYDEVIYKYNKYNIEQEEHEEQEEQEESEEESEDLEEQED